MITMIVALNQLGYIGKDNSLMWKLKDDMKNFKFLTSLGVVIMGSKTFDSIGHKLPKRYNVVVTTRPDDYIDQVEQVVTNEGELHQFLIECRKHNRRTFIIGGAEIYEQCWDFCNAAVITKVHEDIKIGDVKLPNRIGVEMALSDGWTIVDEKSFSQDDNNEHDFTISTHFYLPAGGDRDLVSKVKELYKLKEPK